MVQLRATKITTSVIMIGMATDYGRFLRSRRAILSMSQRDLARRAVVKQPLIAAIESGTRVPSADARAALEKALAIRPAAALSARRDQVCELFNRAGLPEPQVFGSVARGDDDTDSDIDLLVEFSDQHDIIDKLTLEHDLEALLTFKVDLIDARATGPVIDQARVEVIAL